MTTLEIINIAKISEYLAQVDVAKGAMFGQRVTPLTPKILYTERKAVEWMYDLDPTNPTLALTGPYLYSLCRGYNLRAQAISGSGGSISPVDPSVTSPEALDFIVDGSSPIATGESSKIFPQFIGYNLDFFRNGIAQNTTDVGASFYTWDRDSGLFTCFPAAQATELFRLSPTV